MSRWAECHNCVSVRPVLRRAVVALVVAPYVALSAAVAPEHVHEADAEHPHSAIHRHVQAHVAGSHDSDHAQLADDDGHVVWLDSGAFVYQFSFQFWVPALSPAERFDLVPGLVDRVVRPDYDAAPAHGPPRTAPSLRGPPASRLT